MWVDDRQRTEENAIVSSSTGSESQSIPSDPQPLPESQYIPSDPQPLPVPQPISQPIPEPHLIQLEKLHLQRRIQDLEAILALRDEELEQRETELLRYHTGCLGDDKPAAVHPAPFVRPQPTTEQLLTSSMWARSGLPDPSVEQHPPSSWYLWFRSTPPFTANDNADFLILEPAEPVPSPDQLRTIPFSLPQYVFPLLGPDARRVDESRAREAETLLRTGRKIKPPAPTTGLYRSLGHWEGLEIVTVLQAHNLRHCAVTDRDICAIRAYKSFHTRFTDRSLCRSEGVEYLMKAYPGDVRHFS